MAGDAPGRKDGNRGGVRGARGARVARALFVIVNVQHENEALRVDAEGEIVRDEVRQRRELFGRADARVQKHRRALISGARPAAERATPPRLVRHPRRRDERVVVRSVRVGLAEESVRLQPALQPPAVRELLAQDEPHEQADEEREHDAVARAARPTLRGLRVAQRGGVVGMDRECRRGPRAQHSQPMLERFISFGYGSSIKASRYRQPMRPAILLGLLVPAASSGGWGARSRWLDRARAPLRARALRLRGGAKADAKGEEGGEIDGPCIGIDLGTTYSCVGVWQGGRVEICANDQGNRITPSYVAFADDNQRLIGDAAKNQAASNPENTVYDVKRLIGRKFSDTTVQRDRKLLPYEIVDASGKPHVSIASAKKSFSPEEVSAMILTKMKQTAEAFLGREVKHAVITVRSRARTRARARACLLRDAARAEIYVKRPSSHHFGRARRCQPTSTTRSGRRRRTRAQSQGSRSSA